MTLIRSQGKGELRSDYTSEIFLSYSDYLTRLHCSSWANIEVYNLPEIVMGLALPDTKLRSNLGISTDYISIKNIQLQYDTNQDTGPIKSNLAVVSPEHNSIQFLGNMWRAWELTTPLSPSALGDFIVSFDFSVAEKGEIHGKRLHSNHFYPDVFDRPNSLRSVQPFVSMKIANMEMQTIRNRLGLTPVAALQLVCSRTLAACQMFSLRLT